MKTKEEFLRFVGAWFTYLIVSTAVLKWIVVPELGPNLGDACVAANMVLMLVVRGIAFFSWGPIRGNRNA